MNLPLYSQRARRGAVSGIGRMVAFCPNPHVAKQGFQQPVGRGARIVFADHVLIRVDQKVLRQMKWRVIARKPLQQKGFKTSSGVRKMPFGRTDVGHGLYDKVLGQQRPAQPFALKAHVSIQLAQLVNRFIGSKRFVYHLQAELLKLPVRRF